MARVIKSTHPVEKYADGGEVETTWGKKIGNALVNGAIGVAQGFESDEKKKARAALKAEDDAKRAALKKKCDGESLVYGKPYSEECK